MTRRFRNTVVRLVVRIGLVGTATLPVIAVRGCGPWWEVPRRMAEF